MICCSGGSTRDEPSEVMKDPVMTRLPLRKLVNHTHEHGGMLYILHLVRYDIDIAYHTEIYLLCMFFQKYYQRYQKYKLKLKVKQVLEFNSFV